MLKLILIHGGIDFVFLNFLSRKCHGEIFLLTYFTIQNLLASN